jgi:hypothetical protein
VSRIRSRCLNCGELRSCIKIEARAPLPHGPVLVFNDKFGVHEQVDYEVDGPMVELCRACLKGDIGTLARHLLESL